MTVITDNPSPLRPLTLEDAPALGRLVRTNRGFLAPTSPVRSEAWFTDEGQERAVRAALAAAEAGTMYPNVLVEAGDVVGILNLNSIIRGALQSASVGYWVAQDRNGRGIATRAVAAAKRLAAEELGLHRLEASTLPDNAASQRVLASNGFVRYGLAPDYLQIAGRWQAHVLFQVTFPAA